MIPVLYAPEEMAFANLGLGSLSEAQNCRVRWQLNGMYELEMQYPVFGRRWQDLKPRQIILATPGPGENPQPFRIYRITAPLLGVSTVYARHIVYDLMGYTVQPFQVEGLDAAIGALQSGNAAMEHPFAIATDKTSAAAAEIRVPRSVWAMLGGQRGSLLDVYGGEWDFDGFTATLRQQLGVDRGLMVRYGKNLQTLEQDENIANTWTAVEPYWLSADELTAVTLPEKRIGTGTFDYTRVLVLDLSAEFETAPTEAQLRSRAKQYISSNQVGIPDVGLDVTFVPLDQTEEYKDRKFLSAINKGDTVTVEFPTAADRKTGEPIAFVRATARAVEYVWLPLEDRYESIRLGQKRANFVTAVAQTQKDVAWLMTRR